MPLPPSEAVQGTPVKVKLGGQQDVDARVTVTVLPAVIVSGSDGNQLAHDTVGKLIVMFAVVLFVQLKDLLSGPVFGQGHIQYLLKQPNI